MSQSRALARIERFLSTKQPEVLSVSGRWGVGKTHSWDEALKRARGDTPLRRYAYVSAFGLRSLDALKTAIVQSTVSLDGDELVPTVESLIEHMSSVEGLGRLGEWVARKGLNIFGRGASTLPYVGKLSDLLVSGAALLIRKQIVCIDDIERAGQGLDVADILGLVSLLRERRGCKVALLLNRDGLGAQAAKFSEYLEKVVDEAVEFEPTPGESATAALDAADALAPMLRTRTEALGIVNIRVIRRIRRFLSFVEPELDGLHDGVTERVARSVALLGWCVFEPALAPDVEHVRRANRFASMFSDPVPPNDSRSVEEMRTERLLRDYGVDRFETLDQVILDGLRAGAFDATALRPELERLDREFADGDTRAVITRPWSILGDGFGDDRDEIVDALVLSIERHADAMWPADASEALALLRTLGRPDEADRLLPVYVAAQEGRPREFFAARHDGGGRSVDPEIAAALQERLAGMPLARNPAQILLEIGSRNSWSPQDVAYLATVPVDDYHALLKRLNGRDLHTVISVALGFDDPGAADANRPEVARRMKDALRRVAAEGPLNRMRVRSYLGGEPADVRDPEGWDDPDHSPSAAGR